MQKLDTDDEAKIIDEEVNCIEEIIIPPTRRVALRTKEEKKWEEAINEETEKKRLNPSIENSENWKSNWHSFGLLP